MSVKVNYLNFRDIPSEYKDFNMCEEVMEEFVPNYILTIQAV